ncbi:MAG: GNAT family N-acetyltransferase [Pseudomonadota bacterium]
MAYQLVQVHLNDATAKRLAALHADAFPAHGRMTADDLLVLGTAPGTFILADSEIRFGMLMMRCAADEAEVITIGVVPEGRRQGLGSDLLNAGIQKVGSEGIRTVFLEVDAGNRAAIDIYSKLQFAEIALRAGYYRLPDGTRTDALILRRCL